MKRTVIIVSLFLHILAFLGLDYAAQLRYEEATLEQVIDKIAKTNFNESRQIILFAEAPDIDIMNTEESRLLSKKKQRVKKQSIATKIGRTKNRSPSPSLEIKKAGKTKDKSQLSELVKPKKIDFNKLGSIYETSGTSTIGEKIFNDLPIGQFTSLNTDQYSYYSFTERVNDRIRSRWTNKIEESLVRFKRSGLLRNLPASENTTIIEVRLDKKGNYQGSTLYQSSGLTAWDQAAIRAFQDGAPFINPPAEMLEADGLIRLRYSFSVIWHPKYASQIK